MFENLLYDILLRPVNSNTNDLDLIEGKKINSLEIYLWNIDDGDNDEEEKVVKLILISRFLFTRKMYIFFLLLKVLLI